jgi:phage shock protein PspC (stress-responsive transcriptional regulator)
MSETSSTTSAGSGPTSGGTSTGRRPLTRSRSNRKVAGVAGGIAAYLGIDPLIIRIVIVVLTIFGGSGLLLYVAGWLLIPDEGEQYSEIERIVGRDRTRGPSIGAVIVTVIALIVLISSLGALGDHWWFGGPDLWPLVVVGSVVALVWYARRDSSPAAPVATTAAAATMVTPVVTSPAGPAPGTTPGTPPAGGSDPFASTMVDVPVAAAAGGGAAPPQDTWTAPPPPPPPVPRPRRERSVLGAITWWVALVAAGVMFLGDRAGAWHLHPVTVFAVLLAVVGGGLVVGAFVGRSRGLIAFGIVLSVLTALVAAVPAVGAGRTGTVTWAPASTSAIPSDGYSLAAGKATLDLSSTRLDGGNDIQVQLGAGRLVVIVPQDARIVLHANLGVGTLRTPDGRHDDGAGRTVDAVYEAPAAGGSTETLTLRLDVGFGNLEVRYAQA